MSGMLLKIECMQVGPLLGAALEAGERQPQSMIACLRTGCVQVEQTDLSSDSEHKERPVSAIAPSSRIKYVDQCPI